MKAYKVLIPLFLVTFTVLFIRSAEWELLATPEEVPTQSDNNYAILIGISQYDKLPDFESPARDAGEITRILEEKYDFKKKNIVLLTDNAAQKPTRINILSTIDRFVRKLTEKDNLLIYYSGHSTEDEKGETYWIPKDGDKNLKLTWLKHSDICREYLASENFKAKNLIILTDSIFSNKLLRRSSITLSPFDLRYEEKIREKSQRPSREVIAFGDQHWPASSKTEGFGLFAFHLRRALLDNWLKVIDFENLLMTEKIILDVSRVAGTRMISGRLRQAPMEKGGQAILTRVITPPIINIAQTTVHPRKGYAGDKFIVQATTTAPAYEVYIELGGKRYYMDGSGTVWKQSIQVANIGDVPFKVVAVNPDSIPGQEKNDQITIIRAPANLVNVIAAEVSPKKGMGGDRFRFSASTSLPAENVTLVIEGKQYKMQGREKEWSLDKEIEEVGTVAYSVVALNENGMEGRSRGGIIVVKAPPIKVVELKTTPDKGYAGDEFLISAKTDHPARGVALKINNRLFEMEGSGTEWQLKKVISETGKKSLVAVPRNLENIEGQLMQVEVLARVRPAGIPDITAVAFSPTRIYTGEDFTIRVKTSSEAEKVSLEMDGRKLAMDGAGTNWRYTARLANTGKANYRVQAVNREGKGGRSRNGVVSALERVVKAVDVIQASVSPDKGAPGQDFTFKAGTNIEAQEVTLVIGENKYQMKGTGRNWSLKQKIDEPGALDYYIIAANEEGIEGRSVGGTFLVETLLANVLRVRADPEAGFAGDEFIITAKTDQPAASVSLELGGVNYAMEGKDNDWKLKRVIPGRGRKTYTVVAKNAEGRSGQPRTGEITTRPAVPDVASVDIEPKKIFAGDSFVVKVRTSTRADQVFLEIEGRKYPMEGSHTDWKYLTQLTTVGTSRYRVEALNSEGRAGRVQTGQVLTAKRPAELINVAKVEVTPAKGYPGVEFVFKAGTDVAAKGAYISIQGKRHSMTGSGTEWSFTQKFDQPGSLVYSITALNEDHTEGSAVTGTLDVEELKKRYTYNEDGTITDRITGEVKPRFRDNHDGTVTDLATNLMWLKEPKRIASDYENADEYCRKLTVNGLSGWRLPTLAEWKDIIDTNEQNPALPPGHPFENVMTRSGYWSKTRHKFGALYVWQVNLWNGKTAYLSKKKLASVWPIRYAD